MIQSDPPSSEFVWGVFHLVGAQVLVVHVRHIPPAAMMFQAVADPSVLESLDELESEVRQEAVRVLGDTDIDWDFAVRAGSPGEK